MASIIALGNLKGGVGKSTLAVNLACALAQHGATVLADADEQATAVAWARAGRLPVQVHPLPLGTGAAALKSWITAALRLRPEGAGVLLIDLPPHLGSAITAALTVADLLVVPVPASGMDLQATSAALALLRQARELRGDGKPGCLLVPSRIDARTAASREIHAALARMGEPVGPAISQRAAHVDAFSAGEWIGDYAPGSPAHKEIEAVAAVVMGRIG